MKIKVIGFGDTGCRIVSKMIWSQNKDIETVTFNSLAQVQNLNWLSIPIPLGLGDDNKRLFEEAGIVVLVAGMGDYTTLNMELVADKIRYCGILTIAVVTTPFSFESEHCLATVEEGINRLLDKVDSLCAIHNENLVHISDPKISLESALWVSDEVVQQTVRAITNIITLPTIISLDFDDFKTFLKDAGLIWMSFAKSKGSNRAFEAVKMALASPIIDASVGETKAVLFNISGSADIGLDEVKRAAEVIKQAVNPKADITFGVSMDTSLEKEFEIVIIGANSKYLKLAEC